ncbi:S-layer homology domain-containing protein [Tenuibacillus multivorans]|uniref:S-layer homology domain-containing protein n=1 Tax=Tenuibacillus multivorans TaxID=237069 RepID=A0A1H0FHM7_9BACI|nr:YusW family protein [Tenuibacillus multivorans]GEL77670.1 hypothetical protein TMU01_19050 [Tenuibacillus multivorans]SDN94175.1 S-layer homology domain-containing protein [Tenuibacillus multivorans]
MKKTRLFLGTVLMLFIISLLAIPALAAEDGEESNQEREGIQFDFNDLEDAPWAEEYIGKMQSKDVIYGYDDGTFRPNAPVKRIEAIVMAVRLLGLEDEALSKPSDTALHFKDEKQIPSWGRGHVVVALENGLFNATEDKIQADKPASRVWIVQLLVRALGLEDEALEQMTSIPDFKDVNTIPAGSIGYVNVALEQDITAGYPDNTFKPNKKVTRGEMAAFLDSTNEDLLEQSGAVTVQGTVTDISFEQEIDETESTDVEGSITIETSDGDKATYHLPSDLIVQYYDRFISANQLIEGDMVTLVIKNDEVVEASLLNEDQVNTTSNLIELEIKVEDEEQEYKLKYQNKKGKVRAEVKSESKDQETKLKGKEAVAEAEEIIQQLALSSDMTREDIVTKVLNTLQIEEGQYEELEIKIKFTNGKKVDIELEDEGKEESQDNGYNGIREFELGVKLLDDQKLELKYENEEDKVKAEVKRESKEGKEQYKGEQAVETLESFLDEIALSEDMTKDEILETILSELDINREDINELEIEIDFTNEKEVEIEIENDDDDDEDDEDDDHDDDDDNDDDEEDDDED